jgi:hypothetical protein
MFAKKLGNRLWGLVHGIWLMMMLNKETYGYTWAYYGILALAFYFICFGDAHFGKKEPEAV